MKMLLITRLLFSFFWFVSITIYATNSQQFQRLIQPSRGTKLTMTPGLTLPSLQLNTIESSFTMKMPIAIRFPTVSQMAQNLILQAVNVTKTRQAKSDTQSQFKSMFSRVNSRANFYRTIENSHKSLGKSCLLRAICEVAEVPFISTSTGFLGEIFDLLLTSSFLKDKHGKLTDYIVAEQTGRRSLVDPAKSCKKKYSSCPISVFKIMEITNEIF